MTDDRGVQAETLDLDGIRARCEAATEGPWRPTTWGEWLDDGGWGRVVKGDVFDSTIIADSPCRAEDVRFIAAARSDVPALLVEVERLRAKVEAVEALHHVEERRVFGLDWKVLVSEWCAHCGVPAPCQTRAALASHDGKDGQKCDTCHGEPEILLNEAQHGGVPAHHGPCPDCSKGDQR